MKISDLHEATKTKTKTKPDLSGYETKNDSPIAKVDSKDDAEKEDAPKKISAVSRGKTLAATNNIKMNDQAAKHLANLAKMDVHDDEPETHTDVVVRTAESVPKVIKSEMQKAGFLEPDWHLVSNLPGNMAAQIRQLGKSLFSTLTSTKTDQITMIADLSGMGPNTSREINAVAAYLKKEGKDLGPGNIDFSGIMPGYKADIHNYTAAGVHFMLVSDFMGRYIYCWPEQTTLIGKSHARLK